MPGLSTTDERERRFIEYIHSLNKGQLNEFRLSRLNRIANFRKSLMQLVNDLVEARAEDLAAAMWLRHAPERPPKLMAEAKKRIVPIARARRIPPWLQKQSRELQRESARKAAR
jgi:hypothetical protein